MKRAQFLIIILSILSGIQAWDNDELEIFDLVEEVNKNFYELMGLSQDATGQEIKRAFRNLSIYVHPDKNDAEDANIQFRNLVSVYEILKDPSKREKYNKVLKDGLPNWKSAVYYYRRVRRMGLAEMSAILFFIFTIGQYLVAWGVYFERKYTTEQLLGARVKRQKKNKGGVDIDEILKEIPTPTVYNTLPFQIPRFFWNLPRTIKEIIDMLREYTEAEKEKKRLEAERIERERQLEEELVRKQEARKELKETIRKRRQAQRAPEKTDEELAGYSQLKIKEITEADAVRPVKAGKAQVTGGFWSDDDLIELVRLVKKYPSGTTERWEIIGEAMNRTVAEVTFMAAKLKENGYKIPGHNESVAENIVAEAIETASEVLPIKTKVKTKKTNPIITPESNWSQEQQRALEAAIVKYRKTGSADRWQKIANSVPDKTREECLVRYKYLCELIKSQKASADKKNNIEENITTLDEDEEAINLNPNQSEIPSEVIETISKKPVNKTDSHVIEETEIKVNNTNEEENDENVTEITETEPIIEETTTKKTGGKRRNKRKERKKRQEFSSDEFSE